MPIRRSQKKRNAEPRQKQNHRRLVIDPMVNPGSSAHRHQARSKADPTRPHHCMVTLAQGSPGDRSACEPPSTTATEMLRQGWQPRADGLSLPTKISKTTPCKVTGGRWHGCFTRANILTCRANQRQHSIIAQFVKPPMALPIEIAVTARRMGGALRETHHLSKRQLMGIAYAPPILRAR